MNPKLIFSLIGLVLSGCQAQDIEIELDTADIRAASQGELLFVDFEASVGEKFTTIDDEKRTQIDEVVSRVERFFPEAEVEVDFSGDGYTIELEGELALTSTAPTSGPPYYVRVSQGPIEGSLLITLEPTQLFDAFSAELSDLSFMLRPDPYQLAEFKVRGEGESILVFGSNVDGYPITAAKIELTNKRTRISMSEGIWEETPVGFVLLNAE